MAQIIELLGVFSRSLIRGRNSDKLFNRHGELKEIKRLNLWPLEQVFIEKYHFPSKEAKEMTDFLLPMLHPDPKKRITAKECLESSWIGYHPYL